MDFFEAQSQARTRTVWFILLFIVGVLCWIIISTFFVFNLLFLVFDEDLLQFWKNLLTDTGEGVDEIFSSVAFYVTIFFQLITIGLGIARARKFTDVRKATEAMGGQLMNNSPTDEKERMLKNIVSEMSIASGAPMPGVYIMPDDSINAFTAGGTPQNAIIVVTRGALVNFNRDQLQGVIAHEFSHIMNGDMRLNTRMILGIVFFTAINTAAFTAIFTAMNSNHDLMKKKSGFYSFVVVLFVLKFISFICLTLLLGLLGFIFGKILKSSISRQREYLADAAAVQFTRNPFGIASALEFIYFYTGLPSSVEQPKKLSPQEVSIEIDKREFAHMMFSNLNTKSNFYTSGLKAKLSTHPPLEKRIVAILPTWNSQKNRVNQDSRQRAIALRSSLEAKNDSGDVHTPINQDGSISFATTADSVASTSEVLISPSSISDNIDKHAESFDEADAATVIEKLGTVDTGALGCAHRILEQIPAVLIEAEENSYSARALIYAILLDRVDADIRQQQLLYIEKHADVGVYDLTLKLLQEVDALPQQVRLALLQLSMPALRQLSEKQYMVFHDNLNQLIDMDSKLEMFEWCVSAIVIFTLSEHFKLASRKRSNKKTIDGAMSYALSILWRAGGHTDSATEFGEMVQDFEVVYDERGLNSHRLYDSLNIIKNTNPKTIKKFTQAAIACVSHDGKINEDEAALLRAYLMLLGCPMPLVGNAA